MFNFSELINDTPIDSFLLFTITFVLLVISAYTGKFIFKRKNAHEDAEDDEARIILGAILSLLGLLIGFVLSISINGYNNRQQTEENEAIAIGIAYQRAQILDSSDREQAIHLLQQYLDARIEFFKSGISDENN
ncbi:Na+-driven multidrug efflux pump [Providencia alcalifaciens]|nr:Na+-driven multidrug efflux pump [Providencia alcalifaciens]